jgi:hypothetical protein
VDVRNVKDVNDEVDTLLKRLLNYLDKEYFRFRAKVIYIVRLVLIELQRLVFRAEVRSETGFLSPVTSFCESVRRTIAFPFSILLVRIHQELKQ